MMILTVKERYLARKFKFDKPFCGRQATDRVIRHRVYSYRVTQAYQQMKRLLNEVWFSGLGKKQKEKVIEFSAKLFGMFGSHGDVEHARFALEEWKIRNVSVKKIEKCWFLEDI